MEITNKVIKHPKSQMTSVTDNVIKNNVIKPTVTVDQHTEYELRRFATL